MIKVSIIKKALIDSFQRKEEFDVDSQDYKDCQRVIDVVLKAAKIYEYDTYEEFKSR